ncbi:FAS1 domain-containing protein [[Candida] railenensis]|uniref:FAS1 domain-containing protein n=1 Tax=[Candida] railenensis TaxID=45579 RepID=A0A9P0QUZ2_9ASCO|nr:FAS1 domain-containing protein [[Candida] railenensis]
MKLSILVLTSLISAVVAKNVMNLKQFQEAYESETSNYKRCVKENGGNIYLTDLKSILGNINEVAQGKLIDLKKLAESLGSENLQDESEPIPIFDGSNKEKREAKNVVALTYLLEEVDKEISNNKRRDLDDGRAFIQQLILKPQVVITPDQPNVGGSLLQSALPLERDISIFAGYIRDQVPVAQLTGQLDNPLLIIAPTDNAISKKLNGLKPWEFPKDVEEDEAAAEENLSNFVESHIIKESASSSLEQWDEFFKSQENLDRNMASLNGKVVSIVREAGETYVLSLKADKEGISAKGNKVDKLVRVENGFILVINDSLVVPE